MDFVWYENPKDTCKSPKGLYTIIYNDGNVVRGIGMTDPSKSSHYLIPMFFKLIPEQVNAFVNNCMTFFDK